MKVIPAINENFFPEVEKKIKTTSDFGADWVHLDVSDGKFTDNLLWNNPHDLIGLKTKTQNLKPSLEVHLMVENPETVVGDWIDAGVKRIIVHAEAVRDLESMKSLCAKNGVELFIAGNPDTPVGKFLENKADGFLVLAVKPGKAGQKFGESQLEKIKLLRAQAPDAKIIVDGGVNPENAPQIKSAGADMLVAASAIWGSGNPAEAYKKLIEL